MASYLIEYRLSGYPQKYFKNVYYQLKRNFGPLGGKYYRYVPHITIVAPTSAIFEGLLITKIKKIIFSYADILIKTKIKSGDYIKWKSPEKRNVIGVNIFPPKELINLKKELETAINKGWFSHCITYEKNIWHASLILTKGNSDIERNKIQKIWNYLRKPQHMEFFIDRITLLKDKRILKEFDLVNKNILNREEAKDVRKRYEGYLKLANK